MSEPTLKVGSTVELEVLADDGVQTYPSRVEALGDTVLVSLSGEQGTAVDIPRGIRVNLRIRAPAALFILPALSLASWQGELPMLELAVVGAWQQIQRRGDVRLAVNLAVEGAWFLEAETRASAFKARLREISAGGAQVEADVLLLPGDLVELKFALDQGGPTIQTKARVVRLVHEGRREGRPSWRAGVQFLGMKSEHEHAIRRFVFSQQRLLRRERTG